MSITKSYAYEGPHQDTIYDERMGVIENGKRCITCGESNYKCIGHYGHIELPEPTYNPKCLRIIYQILKCICLKCGRLKLSDISATHPLIQNSRRANRLKAVMTVCDSVEICPYRDCESVIPKLELKQQEFTIKKYLGSDKKKADNVTAAQVYDLFRGMSNETFQLLGFNDGLLDNEIFKSRDIIEDEDSFHVHQIRPECFIFEVLPVIPPCARTWVIRDGEKHNDDLTDQYNSICKHIEHINALVSERDNQREEHTRNSLQRKIDDYIKQIQYAIYALIDNHIIAQRTVAGRQTSSFQERIQGKTGRVQQNVGAKRVDFSARAVIVCDPNVRYGEISIPKVIAENQSKMKIAFDGRATGGISNIEHLQKQVDMGRVDSIIRGETKFSKANMKDDFQVMPGDKVYVQLSDGDYVLFNRQPTLRKESIQMMKVVTSPHNNSHVLGFSVAQTKWFGADFDGDEMNIHIIQGYEANADAGELMSAASMIVSGQDNCCSGLNHDSLIAFYLGTNYNPSMPITLFFDCTVQTDKRRKESESVVFKLKDFYKRASKYYPDYFDEDGELVSQSKYVLVVREKDSDKEKTFAFKSDPNDIFDFVHKVIVQKMKVKGKFNMKNEVTGEKIIVKKGLPMYLFSIRVTEERSIPSKLAFSILFPRDFFYEKKTNVNEKFPTVLIKDGIICPESGPLCRKSLGDKGRETIPHILWKEYSPQVCADFISNCQFFCYWYLTVRGFSMGISDCLISKESTVQIRQKLVEVDVNCQLVISQNENDPEKREREVNRCLTNAMADVGNIVTSNLMKGEKNAQNIMRMSGAKGSSMNPIQISGFVGQQNIAGNRIPMQLTKGTRCLPHFLPGDNSPEARGFVYSNFLIGLRMHEAFFAAFGGREGLINTALKTADCGYNEKKMGRKMEDMRAWYDGTVRDAGDNIIIFLYGDDGFDPQLLYRVPGCKFMFYINCYNVAQRLNSRYPNKTPRALTKDEMKKVLLTINVGMRVKDKSAVIKQAEKNLRQELLRQLKEIKLVPSVIEEFTRLCDRYFETSRVNNRDMVGLIATHGIAEPGTQTTLSTFHSSGISAKATTTGTKKFVELLGVSKKPKTPSCTIFLDDAYLNKLVEQKATKIEVMSYLENYRPHLEYLNVKQLVKSWSIYYVDDSESDDIKERISPIDLIEYENYVPPWWVSYHEEKVVHKGKRWVISFTFNIEKLFEKKVTLEKICNEIKRYNQSFECYYSPAVESRIDVYYDFDVLREDIKIEDDIDGRFIFTAENIDFFFARDVATNYICNIPVQGISGITAIFFTETKDGEWIIETNGSNLQDILSLNSIPIDKKRTRSDSLWELYEIFDIDLTARVLMSEFITTICADGAYANERHFDCLVASMTHTGILTAAHREGIGREAGPIAKGMFEKSVDNFASSGIYTELDAMRGVSASVMFGVVTDLGSGAVHTLPKPSVKQLLGLEEPKWSPPKQSTKPHVKQQPTKKQVETKKPKKLTKSRKVNDSDDE